MEPSVSERPIALLRVVQVAIKRLDHIYNNGQAIKTIFSYEAYGQRLRLKQTLQKLLFNESTLQAKRCEELIWRKVFYEPLHLYKLHVKNKEPADRIAEFELILKMHILSGIGYYQSLLLQLQSESSDWLEKGFCNWLPVTFHIPVYDDFTYNFDQKYPFRLANSPLRDRIVQKCLMYMGDLFRYLIEFGDGPAKSIPYAYYATALNFDPGIGLLHNQMGILDVGKCYGLNAIFHYLLCLGARVPFEGAQGNLSTVLYKSELRKFRRGLFLRHPGKYHPRDFRHTIKKFIVLIQQFLKPPNQPTDVQVASLFQETLFELHLMLSLVADETLDDASLDGKENDLDQLAKRLDRLVVVEESNYFSRYHDSCSLFSNQLTGPIFVRILMIALLTANHVESRMCFNTTRKAKAKDEGVSKGNQTETNCRDDSLDKELQTSELTESDNQEDDALKTTGKDRTIYDPHGPFAFLLSLTELYMLHCSIQIADLLHDLTNDMMHGSKTFDAELPTEEETGGKRTPSTERNVKADDGGNIPETASADVGSSDWSRSTSEDDSDEVFHIGRLRKKVQEHEDFERSDVEQWHSDGSSIFHSQDELDSFESSSDGDDNMDLKKHGGITCGLQRFSRATDSQSKEMATDSISKTDRGVDRLLDPLQEEDVNSVPSTPSAGTSEEEEVQEPHQYHLPTCSSKKHSRYVKGTNREYHSPGRYSGVPGLANPTTCNVTRLSVISRVFLLAPVKLVLDWLVNAHHGPGHQRLAWLSIFGLQELDQQAGGCHGSNTRWSVLKYWCRRLAFLLTGLHPVVSQVETELTAATSDAIGDGPSRRLTDQLTPFGITALRRLLQFRPFTQTNQPLANAEDGRARPPTVYPLPEDWLLRGLASLVESQTKLDYGRSIVLPQLSQNDEAILRATQLVILGRHFAEKCTPIGIPFKYVTPTGVDEHNPSPSFCFLPRDKPHQLSGASTRDGDWNAYTYRRYYGRTGYQRRLYRRTRPSKNSGYSSAPVDGPWPGPHRHRGTGRVGGAGGSYRGGGRYHVRGCHEPHVRQNQQYPHDRHIDPKSGGSHCVGDDPDVSPRLRDEEEALPDLPAGRADQLDRESPDEGGPLKRNTEDGKVDSQSRRVQGMRDMARLRLLDEVDHLARQCRSQSPHQPSSHAAAVGIPDCPSQKTEDASSSRHLFVSPYLVLDAFCLTGHLSAIKQMVRSGAFVLLVPTTVIAHLDYLKKTMATARVAIRYLEQETQGGNQYLRLQRPEEQLSETLSLPYKGLRQQDTGSPVMEARQEHGQSNDPVNPRVLKRWLAILDCAVYFTQTKKLRHPSDSQTVPETNNLETEEDGRSDASSSTCSLLTLRNTPTDPDLGTEPQNVLATILVGSRDAPPEDVTVPKQFVKLVHQSGVRLELLRDFFQRWRRSGRT